MQKTLVRLTRVTFVAVVTIASTLPADAQTTGSAVSLPTIGRFARGGEFSGTATINRFEQRGAQIFAIGLVRGTLSRGNRQHATVIAGQVEWPVLVHAGALSPISGPLPAPRLVPARLSLAQAEVCPVLNVVLAPVNVNLLGLTVSLDPIALDLQGVVGTPLGDLVCAVSDLLGNVAGLVNLLNAILGLLTGLLGGIGGLVPSL
jgi:hypothetical protein